MSARSSTSSSERPEGGSRGLNGFLAALGVAMAFWLAVFAAGTLLVDPYGLSPVKVTIPGFNAFKPQRVDIDRILKPIEVWQQAPRTILLGTSRIHQSMNPMALADTPYWPAYNAAIPDGSLALNEGYLHHYAAINPRLETVFVELFLYNFLIPVPDGPVGAGQPLPLMRFGVGDLLRNARDLLFSADTIDAAIRTVLFNRQAPARAREILPGGQLHTPPGHNARNAFSGFPAYIWTLHPAPPMVQGLNPAAFEKVQEMQDLADAQGLSLAFLLTPDNPIFDFYVDQVDAWDLIADWITRLSTMVAIYAPAGPDHRIGEPIGTEMTYWFDPFHFTPEMGRAIAEGLTGRGDFLVRLTPEAVPALIDARRQAVARWALENPHWVSEMQVERQASPAALP